jgi:hypothetical protein
VAGEGHGFVDVFNIDGTPGLAGGKVRLISRGRLDSPWGLAIAPTGFAGISGPHNDPVLLVGNFGNGFINAYDASTGRFLTQLKDPDGEPIQIDHLWALKVGNGGAGGDANTVYFTAGIFDEQHGLFGSLSTAAPGSPEGPAEAQVVVAALDVVQIDLTTLISDINSGADPATIAQDMQTLEKDFDAFMLAEQQFAQDSSDDGQEMAAMPAMSAAAGMDNQMQGLFGSLMSAAPDTVQAEAVAAALDAVQLDLATLTSDISSGAPRSTIAHHRRTPDMHFAALMLAERQFAQDSGHDQSANDQVRSSGPVASAPNGVFADLGSLDMADSGHDQQMATRRPPARHAAATQDIDRLFAAGWSLDL